MADEIDRLEIVVESNARNANAQLDLLIAKLSKMQSALSGVNSSGLTVLANGVQKLSTSMSGMKSVGTADFTRLSKNIQKISAINVSGLNSAASSMYVMSKSLGSLGASLKSAEQIGELAKNISKLGGKNVTTAIANMPQLANALKSLMSTLSKAPTVSKNLINMTNALSNLASQGSKVKTATNGLTGSLNTYSTQADKSTKSSMSLATSLATLYAKFYAVKRVATGLFSSVGKSMDFLETVNYFEVAMRNIGNNSADQWKENGYSSAQAYADSFTGRMKELTTKMTGFKIDADGNTTMTGVSSLGLDPDDVLQYQTVFAQMSDSLGQVGETSLNTSKALTMLGADWASLRNISLDTSWNKFASALAGQTRAVRSLGLDVTVATLQEYAYKYGLEQSITTMNQATKAQLRLLAMLDQSKVAFGDLANTINSPANQLRILQQNFSNLSRIIGNLFLNTVAKVLPYINGLVMAMQSLFTWIGGLLGIKFESINSSIGGASDETADLLDNADGTADALDDASNSAKKLKGNLLGIDKLNIISEKDSSGKSGAIGGSAVLDKEIAKALADYEKAWDDAFKRMENKAQDFADKVTSFFKKIYTATLPFREAVINLWNDGLAKFGNFTWTALKDFYENFLVPIGTWAFATEDKGITRLVNVVNDLLNKVKWDEINKNLKEFWIAIEPYAEQFGEGLIDFFKDMGSIGVGAINLLFGDNGALPKITKWLEDHDAKAARQWAYAFGVLFTSIYAYKKLTEVTATIGILAKNLGLISSLGVIAATVYVGIEFSKDYTEWKNNIDKYGSYQGKRVTAIANPANPYRNGIAAIQEGEEPTGILKSLSMSPFQVFTENLKKWQQDNRMVRDSEKAEFDTWYTNVKTKLGEKIETFKDWQSGNREKRSAEQSEFSAWWENLKVTFSVKWSEISTKWRNDISLWWTNDVSPWFTIEKWSNLASNIKNSISTGWMNLKAWWSANAVSKWWNEDVAPWFTYEKWSSMLNGASSSANSFMVTVKGYFSNGINDIVYGFMSLPGRISSALSGLYEIGRNAIMNLKNGFENMHINMPHFKFGSTSYSAGRFSVTLPTFEGVDWYANGGLPDTGEMFVARESGPEMVGRMGGSSAVANNDQIVSGIAVGVENGVSSANYETNALLKQLITAVKESGSTIEINGREVFSAVKQENAKYKTSTGKSAFA